MSLVDYAIAARRRSPDWRTLRFQPGLLLAWAIMIVAALMAVVPQLFTAYNPLEGFPGAQRLAPRRVTGWAPTSLVAICGVESSTALPIRSPLRWRQWRLA